MYTYSRNTNRAERNCVTHGTLNISNIHETLVTGLEEPIDLIAFQTNLYAQQRGRDFDVDNNELKAFLEINYITLWRSVSYQCGVLEGTPSTGVLDNLTGNNVIQNTTI